jgi:hypothetical protein
MENALNSLRIAVVDYDIQELGMRIQEQIRDVGRLHLLSIGDLRVFGPNAGVAVVDVRQAIQHGTRFFDALFYFALPNDQRPQVQLGVVVQGELETTILSVKRRLLWMAIFLMLRGSYPSDAENNVGANVPAFLRNICGMDISPAALAESLATFNLRNINPNWIRHINWTTFAPEIRQRLGLGLAGYRLFSPFTCYQVRDGAPEDVRLACGWVAALAQRPADYAILSCTRSPDIVNRFKSWNRSLGNLILLAFTDAQIDEMVQNRIIYARPVRDPRSDTWRTWVLAGELVLNDPIQL